MELGVQALNTHGVIGPRDTAALARRAEELGYDSWWASDHVVHPAGEVVPFADPLVHLGFVAAVTSRLELGTGVLILPQRNPLVLAKQAATLDVLSEGRLRLGVGVGWQLDEMRAVGVSPADRGRLTDEHIDAMRALWAADVTDHRGRHVSFGGVDALPKPVSPNGPELLVGGHSPPAFRRAVTKAHGWYGVGGVADLEGHLASLAQVDAARPEWLGRLEITFLHMHEEEVTAGVARRYAALGVDRLVVMRAPVADVAEGLAFLEQHADLPR